MAYRAYIRTERLRALCDRNDISIPDLADALDIDRSSAYRLVKGRVLPSNIVIAGFAVIFGEDRLGEVLHFAHSSEPEHDQRPKRNLLGAS